MKICHCYIFFSIRYAGGTSDLMYKLCKAQIKDDIQPAIYTGNYQFDEELASTLKGVEFKIVRSYFDKYGFSIMPGLIKLAKNDLKNYDVVHMHVFRTFQNVVLYFFCKRYKIPYVIDAHGAVPYYRKKKLIKYLFDLFFGKQMLKEAACLIAETKVGIKEYLDIEPSLDKNKIIVLSPPFDTDEFLDLPEKGVFRAEYGIKERHVIMFLGRIHHIKGNDFLIKGFSELLKKNRDCRLVLVGSDDGHMEECKQLAIKLGISDKVTFTGFLYAEKKKSALIDADVVAQLSRQEQGAWAPFEAVLCGTPIIVSSHTGAGEDVRKIDAGYLIDLDDVIGLAEKLQWMLDNYKLVKEKTLKARKYISENLSFHKRAHEYKDIYARCITNN